MLWLWGLITIFVSLFIWYHLYKALSSKKMVDDIASRYVVITGCDTGFGNLLSKRLDIIGVNVISGCLTDDGAKKLKDECSSRLKTIILDVTDEISVQKAAAIVRRELPQNAGLWGLVNNAGVMPHFAPMEMLTVEDFKAACNVNLFGAISMTLNFLPLIRQGRGRVVNVCSIVATSAYPGLSNYCISKTGLKTFSTCIRRELYRSGVTVHTINPGGFKTNITNQNRLESIFRESFDKCSEDLKSFYGGRIAKKIISNIRLVDTQVSFKPHLVSDAMEHALLSRNPQRDYIVGYDARFFFRPISILPDIISDLLFSWPAPYGERVL
ncbi:hypothetical protein ACJMK2_020072 [Sinanodonta woodiana]|uniref:Uncharacterized protein n=1 Tax=Sinanodonta woodiana TaxID=1069815 RepID=A0ABD3TZM3_SINWO